MKSVRYITDAKGQRVEVILPLKEYEALVDCKENYEERLRILTSIKDGAKEIVQDRIDSHLNQELSEFIDEIEDRPH